MFLCDRAVQWEHADGRWSVNVDRHNVCWNLRPRFAKDIVLQTLGLISKYFAKEHCPLGHFLVKHV